MTGVLEYETIEEVKKIFQHSFCLLVFLLCFTAVVTEVSAADLNRASIRLTRHKTNTTPGAILIMAQTGENVTESGVKVTVPSAWTISGTASNFTVSTANLPSGITAWPGIGTASTVGGQTITFPSSNINVGTTYGFFITGGIGSNPTVSSNTEYLWSLATQVGGIDSSTATLAVPIIMNDQVVITATIEPDQSYFSVDLDSATAGTTINQDTEVTFEITYGSTYTFSSPLTVQAEWDQGSLVSNPSTLVDIWEYVVGSATNAYGGTPPVVNLTNRTITWTIASIPSNTTNQTVSFSLRTTAGYTGSSDVELPVSARITNPTTLPDSTITHFYRYLPLVTATPTPSPTSSVKKACNISCSNNNECESNFCYQNRCRAGSNPEDQDCRAPQTPGQPSLTPQPTLTLTPTPTQILSQVNSVSITSITDMTVGLEVQMRTARGVQVRYGLSPNALNEVLVSDEESLLHRFLLENLQAGRLYFFRFYSLSGQPISELFQVQTAVEFPSGLMAEQVLLSSEGIPLFQTITSSIKKSVIVPHGVPAEMTVFLNQEVLLDKAFLFAQNTKGEVAQLGQLIFADPKVLTGKFTVPNQNDEYELGLRLTTPFGALVTFPLLQLITVDPFRVIDKDTGVPIERASVSVWQFDETQQLYSLLPAPSFLPSNPLLSDSEGELHLALPTGKYKLEIKAFGYIPKEVDFSLRGEKSDAFPKVELSPVGWNPILIIQSYIQTITFWLDEFIMRTEVLWQSRAFFNVLSIISLSVLTVLTLLSLQARTLLTIPHLIQQMLQKNAGKLSLFGAIMHNQVGTIIDEHTGRPIGQAKITLLSQHGREVLFSTKTSRAGMYHIPKMSIPYILEVEAVGYKMNSVPDPKNNTVIKLGQHQEFMYEFGDAIKAFFVWSFGMFFESLFIISLFTQFFFLRYLGAAAVLPFLVISVINAVLWGHYLLAHKFRVL